MIRESERQREGRIKQTAINQSYIESGEYRKKFDLITNNKNVNRLLYICAKKMLLHRSGTLYEDMYWIDANTEKIVAQEINQTTEKKVVYSGKTKKIVKNYIGLITIHNHPDGFPPSIDDFNSNYQNRYSMGVVCGHDGKVFMYTSDSALISKRYFFQKVAYFRRLGYNNFDAQLETLKQVSKAYKLKCREVYL